MGKWIVWSSGDEYGFTKFDEAGHRILRTLVREKIEHGVFEFHENHFDIFFKEPDPNTLEDVEREFIIKALERNGWSQYRAAEDLGISKRKMNYKVEKYKIKHRDWIKNK